MKKLLSIRSLLMIASVVVFVSSCKKDETEPSQSASPIQAVNTGTPSTAVIGAINDMGPISADLRLMQVAVNKPGNLYENSGGDFIASVDKIVMNFYSASDGIIPSGTYNYSNSDVKQPFTFDTGIISLPLSIVKAGTSGGQISDGYVSVSYNGTDYVFVFSCSLNTGELLSGTNSGKATYQDSSSK